MSSVATQSQTIAPWQPQPSEKLQKLVDTAVAKARQAFPTLKN